VLRSGEALGALLGRRARAQRPSPNESVLRTTGTACLPRGARLAADASVRHTLHATFRLAPNTPDAGVHLSASEGPIVPIRALTLRRADLAPV